MEIVFGPDLRHGGEAAALVKELVLVLEKLDTCKARMEQGELRVDANISVRRQGEELGVRTEVKNLNSVRSVARAIEYEVARQVIVLEQGGVVENETRSFDFGLNKTITMRDKEAKQDYRFMPEPNLPPLRLCEDNSEQKDMINISPIRSSMPELPAQVRARLSEMYGLSIGASSQLVEWPQLLDYFFHCVPFSPTSYKEVSVLVTSKVQENSIQAGLPALEIILKPAALVEISNMRQAKEISYGAMQQVMEMVLKGDTREVRDIVKEEDLFFINDSDYIEKFAQDIISDNTELVKKYRKDVISKKKQERVYKSLLAVVSKDPRVERVDMATFVQIFKKLLGESKI
jgi:aspartyl-tRNA(Asn)/glutamyl-tRNA(Gln) amidotransferase subunit B